MYSQPKQSFLQRLSCVGRFVKNVVFPFLSGDFLGISSALEYIFDRFRVAFRPVLVFLHHHPDGKGHRLYPLIEGKYISGACQIEGERVETYYFLGNWDGKNRKFEKLHEKARLVDLGKGVFTGPSGFVTPDGRSVVFTIAQGCMGFRAEQEAGWAHNGGMPVELFWNGNGLGVRPIREAESLRKALLVDGNNVPAEEMNPLLAHNGGNMLCLELTAGGDEASVLLCGGEQRLEIRYDRKEKRLMVLDGEGREIGRYRGVVDDVDIGSEPIRFTCYLDHSLLEVYVNEVKSVSVRNFFPERSFQVRGYVNQLKLWELEAAL